MSSSGRFDPAVLSGAVTTTAMATAESRSVIGVETPGLQSVLSWRSSGSIFSDGADPNPKRGILHRMEFQSKQAVCDFAAIRDHLTACVEMFEEAKEDIGLFHEMPPPEIVKHRDLFERIWGWERLIPVYNLRYLEEYYRRNTQASLGQQQRIFSPVSLFYLRREKVASSTQSDATTQQQQQHANSLDADDNLAIILVYLCCEKETKLVSEWKKRGLGAASPEIRLSTRIQKKIINLVLPKKNRRVIPPVIRDCISCIMKEAELILEGMRKGLSKGFDADDLGENLGHGIRYQVFCLIKKYLRADPCSASVATSAVLLGTTKEAELICEKLRRDALLCGEYTLSTSIRSLALRMLSDMDAYVLKTATTDGFCYWDYIDPAAIDMPTWCESEQRHSKAQDTELGKVVDGSDELSKEKHSAKNKEYSFGGRSVVPVCYMQGE